MRCLKKTILLLCAGAVFITFVVCMMEKDNSEAPFIICVDDSLFPIYESSIVALQNENVGVEFEIIRVPMAGEQENSAREEMLLKIRSDIIAGRGPDVFLNYILAYNPNINNNLFPDTVKAIEAGTFVSLENIKNTNNIQSNCLSQLLKATEFKGENYIFPLQFILHGLFAPKTDASTVLASVKNPLEWAAMIDKIYDTEIGYKYVASDITRFSPPFLDYENIRLNYDREWLIEWAAVLDSQNNDVSCSNIIEGPASPLALAVVADTVQQPTFHPMPNHIDGTTAIITAYMAVSATCRNLDIASDFFEHVKRVSATLPGDAVASYTMDFMANETGIIQQQECLKTMVSSVGRKNIAPLLQDVLNASHVISIAVFRDNPICVLPNILFEKRRDGELLGECASEVYRWFSRYVSE